MERFSSGKAWMSTAALVMAGAVGVGVFALRPRAPDAPVPEPIAAPPAEAARVVTASAGVERRDDGADWLATFPGDVLHVTDSLRTTGGATAEILLGRGSRVTVAERSELTVRELTAAAQRLGLVRGRVGVDLQPDGTRVLRVESEAGDAVASGTHGRFGVVAAPSSLGVAAFDGDVKIESAGHMVALPAGTATAAWRGRAPIAPAPIPRGVILRVARTLKERRASTCAVLDVDLASEVTVNGDRVDVPVDGKLVVRVPPRGERRAALVTIRDAAGRVDRRTVPCLEDDADVSDFHVRWAR